MLDSYIKVFLGIFAFAALVIFGITSAMIYKNTRRKVFIWYSLYCFILMIYVSFKWIPFYNVIFLSDSGLNWFIQTLFYTVYLRFGIHFIGFSYLRPKTSNYIFHSQIIILVLSVIAFLLDILDMIKMLDFFIYLFLPFELICVFIIVHYAYKSVAKEKIYFLYATFVYIILALTAFILSLTHTFILMSPINYFFLAVIIETFIFSFGLGKQVKDMYNQKLLFEKDLNKTQMLLHDELEKKIEKQEEINRLLESENLSKKLELEVLELNSTVLRNQMNSHFVFNVLNSIKVFMMQNEKDKAIQYLSKFAKFMRKVLDANFYGNVTLHEELESIELYLSIELMRFDYNFSYLIDISPSIDLYKHRIPAFIVQPFVENVLWHAFVSSSKNKHLLIQITEDYKIIIEDNGIGRIASALNNNKITSEKSHGLRIVQERLNYYNKNNNKNISFEIEDISMGTRVVIYFAE